MLFIMLLSAKLGYTDAKAAMLPEQSVCTNFGASPPLRGGSPSMRKMGSAAQ
jgi:hypothetical protein